MSADAAFLAGVQLVDAKGEAVDGAVTTRGKLVAVYFAADWCPDCRIFQPTLNAFYKRVNAEKPQLEVVFVGSDRSSEDQQAHLRDKQGPWWAVPFESEHRNALKRKFGVCLRREQEAVGVAEIRAGIPALALVKADGELLQLLTDQELETSDGLAPVAALLEQQLA